MKLFSFEVILCMIHFPFNEKVHNCTPCLSLQSQKYIKKHISGPHPDVSTYTDSLQNDENNPDGRYLYGVTPEWWKRSWLSPKRLYSVLTLMAQTYTESLLMIEAPLMVTTYTYHSWMTESLLTVIQNPISGPHSNNSDQYRVTPEWRKRSWWLLPIWVTHEWWKRSGLSPKSLYRVLTLMAQT